MQTNYEPVAPSSKHELPRPRRLSPAAINTYGDCPRRFWFQYVARREQRRVPAPMLVVGNAVHGALERFFGLPPTERTLALLHRALRSVWPRHREQGAFLTREEEADYGRMALLLLTRFHESFETKTRPLTRERWVSTRLPNGVELFGKVDRIDIDGAPPAARQLSVVDYKTGRLPRDGVELADEPAAQIYALATEDECRGAVTRCRFLYLQGREERRWEPEREDLDAARTRLIGLTDAILADKDFAPRPSERCSSCPFAEECPSAGVVAPAELEIVEAFPF